MATNKSSTHSGFQSSKKTSPARKRPETDWREHGGPKRRGLQARFIEEYLIDLNATQAAIRAGYSEKTAQEQGSRLLSNVMVRDEIDRLKRARSERVWITQDRVLQELARIAFFDIRKLLNPDGTPKPIGELDDDTAAALAGLDVQEEYAGTGADRVFVGCVKKYRIADKISALTNAMRHLQMFADKVKVEVTDLSPEALNERFVRRMREAHERQRAVLIERGLIDENK